MLGGSVRLVVDGAERIDAAGRRVTLSSGDTLDYDYLIYAVGQHRIRAGRRPGRCRIRLSPGRIGAGGTPARGMDDIPAAAPVVVVGGGLTGIESAAEFAEQGRPVTLVGDVLAPSLAAPGRRSVAKRLARLGVTVMDAARVAAVAADHVVLTDGRTLPSAVTVWTAGFGVPDLAAASGLTTDALGRLLTDETLTSVDDPRIVAAGDAASPSGLPLRMSCQAALPLGAQAADTVLARIAGTEPAG